MRKQDLVKIGYVLLFVLFQIKTISQQNFLDGWVINGNGDTLTGQINFRQWDANPRKIEFRQHFTATSTNYTPLEIAGFAVAGEKYKSGIVTVDRSPYKLNDLDYIKDFQFENDTVFLEEMVGGEKSLYYYKEARGKENFYVKNDSGFQLLVLKQHMEVVDGKSGVHTNNAYIGQLGIYLGDCPNLKDKLAVAAYTREGIQKIFEQYYACRNAEPVFQKAKEKIQSEFGVLAGLTVTKLSFRSDNDEVLVNSGYPASSSFAAGIFYDLFLFRNLKKWSFNSEVFFTSYKTDGYYENQANANTSKTVTSTIGYSHIKVNSMARYAYPVGDMHLYFNAGVTNGFVISEKNSRKERNIFYSTETVTEGPALESTRKYEPGYLLGVGGKYRSFLLETRLERTTGMSAYPSLNSPVMRYYFLLGCRF